MMQLGGHVVYLTTADVRVGSRESVQDIARNLERWVDFIMARTFEHDTLVQLAGPVEIPVINGLSDRHHPCQVLSDCFTLQERHGRLENLRVAFVGDGNNVANSWVSAAARFGFTFAIACPPGREPHPGAVDVARAEGASIQITSDPAVALQDADVVYTDVWTSMGQEAEREERLELFRGYQVNAEALRLAKPDAVVMHCLPAHRGEEITAEVIDGPQSIVLDEAENRLHVQKGILVWLNEQMAKKP
jgi:ornithine carbamoyltransferase